MESIIYSEILSQIGKGAIRNAINLLSKSVKGSNLENDIIIQAARYSSVERDINRGLITDGQARLSQNQIVYALIELANQAKELNLVQKPEDEAEQEKVIKKEGKTRILFLSANPINTTPLRLDKEIREIEFELMKSKNRDNFEIIKKNAVRVRDLQDGLLEYAPDFVHFSGHGTDEGIVLMDNHDYDKIVENEPLSRLFGLFTNEVSCVFLNSCYSEKQAKLIKKHIPNVIGMNKAVPDNSAIEFASVFYKAIGAGRPIEFAFEFAKLSIDLNNLSGGDIPVLL